MVKIGLLLEKHGYTLEKVLNNENRWHIKMVCSILDGKRRYVLTSYANEYDYLKLLETIGYLKSNNKLSPEIERIYPNEKAVICDYIGEFLSEYILDNPASISIALSSIFSYLEDINSIDQCRKGFSIPEIVRTSLELSQGLDDFNFLPKTKVVLPKLESSGAKFTYGCGIEDPHIWNFRIVYPAPARGGVKDLDRIHALTTDFDYFTNNVNYFWELGYLYATFRWFRDTSFSLSQRAESFLLSLAEGQNLKSEFMFWLGVLSSYCGYRDSFLNFKKNNGVIMPKRQFEMLKRLDERVSYLADKIMSPPILKQECLYRNQPFFDRNSVNGDKKPSCNHSHKYV